MSIIGFSVVCPAAEKLRFGYHGGMKTYLVGGAVRDELLGLDVAERDWVVVGATPEEMIEAGFKPVGKDFPVFLDARGEEYALARTERKTAPGYHGFVFHAAPDITLEDDLVRRDLTVNAMARDPDSGVLIDPFGGQVDLKQRKLRHVSPAFVEDPVRILRVARFAARFKPLGFSVADETMALMREMVAAGEADALVPERVWAELQRALTEAEPGAFVETLRACGALARIFPELDRLFGVPQPAKHHPEIDCGVHTLMVLAQVVTLSADPVVRFAALVHDLGKGTTPDDVLPSHWGHEERGARMVETLAERLKLPREYRDLAVLVARYHLHCHRALELRASTVLKLLEAADAFRRPERFAQYLICCEADARGRTGLEERDYLQPAYLAACREAAAEVRLPAEAMRELGGPEIGERLRELRVAAVAAVEKPQAKI